MYGMSSMTSKAQLASTTAGLFVEASGDPQRPAIVFLHGLGVSRWMWAEQLASLASDYYCLAVDLPGSGDSHGSPWVSFDDSAARVAELIAARAEGGRAHVVGLSLGAHVALSVLARHPEVVRSTVASGLSTRPFAHRWWWSMVSALVSVLMRSRVLARASAKAMGLPPDAVELYVRDATRLRPAEVRRIYSEVFAFDLGALGELGGAEARSRLLVVAGSREAPKVLDGLAYVRARAPEARTALAPELHHTWSAEDPELFTAMVRAWCERGQLVAGLEPGGAAADSSDGPQVTPARGPGLRARKG